MLIDTSGWLCMLHKDEPEHAKAVGLYNDAPVRVTHSSLGITEALTTDKHFEQEGFVRLLI